jgi:short subunit dehydrogenase-like uncharacterized protein
MLIGSHQSILALTSPRLCVGSLPTYYPPVSQDRDLDVVLFGATSFVGRLCAEYLARAAPSEARIGLAGRSRERLGDLQSSLGGRAADWPLLVADATDPRSLNELAQTARVLATTVGPYRRYGLPVVEACARAGTHYADLTGEVLFMREVIDRFDAVAAGSGARIVHSCGFDSIPSDLGVLLLHEAVTADGSGQLEDTTLVVRAMKGGASGGTVASLKGAVDDARSDRELARVLDDPYALSPDRDAEPQLGPEGDLRGVQHDHELGMWVGPFIMGSINTRAVRRSNALQGWAYGPRFRYREVMGFGSGPLAAAQAGAIAGGVGALAAGLSIGPARAVLDRVLPSPGEGPSESQRERGFFRIEIHARTSSGARYLCRVAAQGDPGYKATAVMFGESGLCLALDGDRLPPRAGVLTPATAMGDALVQRLRSAGQTLEVERT